jgi:hypothetical protein
MDTSDSDIEFDEDGICNHCKKWFREWENRVDRRPIFDVIAEIKERGKDSKYDAILGISGGVDSSLAVWLAYMFDLKILLVHADAGWNSQIAWESIQNIVNKTGFDYEHFRFNHREYRDIIRSYLRAGVIGLEAPTDNILRSFVYEAAIKHKCKTIISGNNWVTEGIMPGFAWGYDNHDIINIKNIHKKFGEIPLEETKFMGIIKNAWLRGVKGFREYSILNNLDPIYNRDSAKRLLMEDLDWKDYGRKHNEDRYTKFVECYIFPRHFGVDKRKAHYSTLICSGQMTRDEALEGLKVPLYTREEEESEIEYFIRKMGLTRDEFEGFMTQPVRSHYEFDTHTWRRRLVKLAIMLTGRKP